MERQEHKQNYFFTALFTLILSVGTFFAFKALLPERLFAKQVHSAIPDITELEEVDIDTTAVVAEYAPFDGLVHFFQKLFTLEKTKKGSVRIAYFGDSMIESDLIVQDIRKDYQKKFGGQGIGFVPLSSLSPFFNGSIRYEYSPEWNTYCDLCLKNSPPTSLGISGYVSYANAGSSIWTNYKRGSFSLAHPRLFYGKSDNSEAKIAITIDNEVIDSVQLKPTGILNKHSLNSFPRELKFQFDNAESIPFYGVDFSGGSGVNVDNFALRSNSGLPLGNLNAALMNAFQREFNYDLIVLQFGANVLNPEKTEYDWYANRMIKVVDHLKICFPNADILVISQADKSMKYGKEIKTDTALAPLIRAQEKYARNTNSAFLDLFQLMGGEGSMVKWASEDPPLVRSDYTHFNGAGAKKIGDLIFAKLNQEYEDFKVKNNLYVENGEEEK
ncbi:MAG: GDSL-type esterase/lipase family protein [Fibromonadaceae bacterium]|jgi:lysophospholipase L1-like esterase|nr:GDSL-type esterase/lipase family protein [Fibromonadaceae bacterium]